MIGTIAKHPPILQERLLGEVLIWDYNSYNVTSLPEIR